MSVEKRNKLIILILRLFIGWFFFYSGLTKVTTYYTDQPDWSAAQFLSGQKGIFSDYFQTLTSNKLIDYLNAYGQLAIGLGVITGTLLRLASFWGIFLMGMYYMAGYPPKNALLIDTHVLYSGIFILLMSSGAGRYFGVDGLVEKTEIVKRNRWLLKLLG